MGRILIVKCTAHYSSAAERFVIWTDHELASVQKVPFPREFTKSKWKISYMLYLAKLYKQTHFCQKTTSYMVVVKNIDDRSVYELTILQNPPSIAHQIKEKKT